MIAREIEGGTLPLAWTQSITRTRWLVVKLAVVGLASMVAAGLLSLIVTWWFRAIDHVNGNRREHFGPGQGDRPRREGKGVGPDGARSHDVR